MCCSSLGECATAAGVNLDYTAVIISPVQLVRAAQTESYNPTFLGIVAGDGIPNYTVSQTMNPGEVAIINCIMNGVKNGVFSGDPIEIGQAALEQEGTAISVTRTKIPNDGGVILGTVTQDVSGGPIANTTPFYPNNRLAKAPQLVPVRIDREDIADTARRYSNEAGLTSQDLRARVVVALTAETALHEIMHTSLGHPRGADDPGNRANTDVTDPLAWEEPTGTDILIETRDAYNKLFGDEPPLYKRAIGEQDIIVLSGCLLNIFNQHHGNFLSTNSAINAKVNLVPNYPIVWQPQGL